MCVTRLPISRELKAGLRVEIETKEDQGTGRLTSGILEEILTAGGSHPYGIKVRLQGGQVGRVKKITDIPPRELADSFEDLDTKAMPETEDKYNEFKEFYQYDEGIESLPDSIKATERGKAVEGIMRSVRERFSIAVCSLGNDRFGGFIYLGIRADGTVAGLERDKKIGNFADYSDAFANHIRDTIEAFLKDKVFVIRNIQIPFRRADSKTICVVQVLPSSSPLYVHTVKGQMFYVRGPSPRAERLVDLKDQIRYIKSRFPHYG